MRCNPLSVGWRRSSLGDQRPQGAGKRSATIAQMVGAMALARTVNDLGRRLSVAENYRPIGFDTLTLVGRSLFAVCRRLSHSGRVVPGVMSRSTEAAEGGT